LNTSQKAAVHRQAAQREQDGELAKLIQENEKLSKQVDDAQKLGEQYLQALNATRAELHHGLDGNENVVSAFPLVSETSTQYNTLCTDALNELVLEYFVEQSGASSLQDVVDGLEKFFKFCNEFAKHKIAASRKQMGGALGVNEPSKQLQVTITQLLKENFVTLLPSLEETEAEMASNFASAPMLLGLLQNEDAKEFIAKTAKDLMQIVMAMELGSSSLVFEGTVGQAMSYNSAECTPLDGRCKANETCAVLLPALKSGEAVKVCSPVLPADWCP
jgi:hypothetical protein